MSQESRSDTRIDAENKARGKRGDGGEKIKRDMQERKLGRELKNILINYNWP